MTNEGKIIKRWYKKGWTNDGYKWYENGWCNKEN